MNKKNLWIFSIVLLCGIFFFYPVNLFAENSDDIVLPNLTTEIENENETIKPDADFPLSIDFELPEGTGDINPELPDFEINNDELGIVTAGNGSDKVVFAEGQIGGGFPGYFNGDFSVYRVLGDDPFRITFKHESAEGYSGTPFFSGFNDKTTIVSAEKRFAYKDFLFDFSGNYNSLENGLQNKVPQITSINQRNYNGSTSFSWLLPKGLLFYTGFDIGGYNRFTDTLYGGNIPAGEDDISIFSLMPELKISWNSINSKDDGNKDFENNGVTAYFSTKYWYDDDLKNDLIEENGKTTNRGEFKIGLSWKNDIVNVFGDAAAVVGDHIGYNDVLVPFTLGVNTTLPVYFSNRKLKINVCGGLDSQRSDIWQLEKMYKFSLMSLMPKETSDWFGKFEINFPMKSAFTANLFVEYRHTASDNGIWQPVYDNDHFLNGGYRFECFNRNLVKTHTTVSYNYKIFTVTGGWLSFWDFVPFGYDQQSITVDFTFQSLNSLWGAALKSNIGIVTKDYIPLLGFEAFVRVTPQVRIVAQVEDAIKLFQSASRDYAGQYVARSGYAAMFVKFFF